MRNQGFTLIELLLTVLIMGILVSIATPNIQDQLMRGRIEGAALNLKQELAYAHSEAIKRNADIFVDATTSDGGATWCVGVSIADNCDCTIADPTAAGACVLPINGVNVLRRLTHDDYDAVSMDREFDFSFDGTRGVASNGTYIFSAGSYEAHVVVSILGRIRVCDETGDLSGWTAC